MIKGIFLGINFCPLSFIYMSCEIKYITEIFAENENFTAANKKGNEVNRLPSIQGKNSANKNEGGASINVPSNIKECLCARLKIVRLSV